MGPIVSSILPLPMILAITRAYMTWALKACTENFLKYCTILFSFQIKDRRWIFMNKNPAFAVSFQQHDLISFEKKVTMIFNVFIIQYVILFMIVNVSK